MVAQAWGEVKKETISNCFRKAGILKEDFARASCKHEEEDSFAKLLVMD